MKGLKAKSIPLVELILKTLRKQNIRGKEKLHRYSTIAFLFLLTASLFLAMEIQPVKSDYYSVTIQAWDNVHDWVSVPIQMDFVDTGFTTPHTFTNLYHDHTFSVPMTDSWGNPYTNYSWSGDEGSIYTHRLPVNRFDISGGGTCTAQYYETWDITIQAWDSVHGPLSEPIQMDGVDTGFNTPHTFMVNGNNHNFTVDSTNTWGNPIWNWSNPYDYYDGNGGLIKPLTGGTFTAQYYPTYSVTIQAWDSVHGYLSEHITMSIGGDEVDTGFNTSHTFAGLSGTQCFWVQMTDDWGNPIMNWTKDGQLVQIQNTLYSNGIVGTVVNSPGTYTAQYYAPPPVIPDFASYLFLPFLMSATLAAVALKKRFRK
jgi:hypothetical protein